MEQIFLQAIALLSEHRAYILIPTILFALAGIIYTIFNILKDELEAW